MAMGWWCGRGVTTLLLLSLLATAFWTNCGRQRDGWLAAQGQPTRVSLPSHGCESCHVGIESTHQTADGKTDKTLNISCVDCHGGDGTVMRPANTQPGDAAYETAKRRAHVAPKFAEIWQGSGIPERLYTTWLQEDPNFIRFVNPTDLRVVDIACGECHGEIVRAVKKSMMTHGAMLWGAALYNNGAFPIKTPRFGESYNYDGYPQRLQTVPLPTEEERRFKGILPFLDPLPRWDVAQPGSTFVLRVFERGGEPRSEVGLPNRFEEAGKPIVKLSPRGLGTFLRVDPVFIGLQKTRLLDPMLSLPGTNDHPGDYRNSGCAACHMVYANDRDPMHSGPYAQYGNSGQSFSGDEALRLAQKRGERGHPVRHQFTNAIPSSQCITCHIHPGTLVMNTYLGYLWWDDETDGEWLYPKRQRFPDPKDEVESLLRNPDATSLRGLWSNLYPDEENHMGMKAGPNFLERLWELNPKLRKVQFADFHGHGWVFRAVFKTDRKGNLLDANDRPIDPEDPDKWRKTVHLRDIHLEKGMHCVDCHFSQDVHGNGKLYGEVRNAIEISCTDCHGTLTKPIRRLRDLVTTGPAAPERGTRLGVRRTPFGEEQFYFKDGKLFQRSMVVKGLEWEVPQVADTVDPNSDWAKRNPEKALLSRLAKTMQVDGKTWGQVPKSEDDWAKLAHLSNDLATDKRLQAKTGRRAMTCVACHSAWVPNCWGCHLPMKANYRTRKLHFEGEELRNFTAYNFQTIRDDAYMLGVDGTVTGNRIAPVHSACAIVVSSQDANRQWLYYQQQTISAEGLSGTAFSTRVPHTVRAKETKMCADCHVSDRNDNNAWLAQLLLLGTQFANFMGRYVFVGEGEHGLEAVAVAEMSEPGAIYGSSLHELAYPENYRRFVSGGRRLKEAYEHPTPAYHLQARGEYLYVAKGHKGFEILDIANLPNKGFSERIVTAPVSPKGQRLFVKTKDARYVGVPTTQAVDPTRTRLPENEEQPVHLLYGFLYVADAQEGLVVIGNPPGDPNGAGISTLLDGNPQNNFIRRARLKDGSDAFNPNGVLKGARFIKFVGIYAYIVCDAGIAVVNLDDPLMPRLVTVIGKPFLREVRALDAQFRYAFVVDRDGLKVLDITFPDRPEFVRDAFVPIKDAHRIYVARTYAYIAAGKQGLVIVDVERPDKPRLDQVFNSDGQINDAHDVQLGMVNNSLFAFVADGKNGLRIVELMSPRHTPGIFGFSPRPTPRLIATYKTHGEAVALSKGIDRDRAVDESGNQIAVFGRRGARPLNKAEMQRLYWRDGKLFTVPDIRKASDVFQAIASGRLMPPSERRFARR
ncbi:MAG: hypothetical protein YPKNTGVA_000853 [Candidatus Fervidibacter sp.]